MKHIHKVNEALDQTGYQLHVRNNQISLVDENTLEPIVESIGSQDARREFGSIAHHGDHHGRHRTLQAEEIASRFAERDRMNAKESLAHIDPFTD